MIEEGDKVMVCVSGGKDSYTLLDILLQFKRIAPINFDVVAVNLDQKQPDTYSITKRLTPEGKTYCAVCSRLRRGSLYGFAQEIGATKVALGHHRDDIIATFFLNLFHGGSLKAMPPKLLSSDKKNILIRPLAYVEEKDIIKYAEIRKFPIIPCNLCGSQENLQRAMLNDMLRGWDKQYPKHADGNTELALDGGKIVKGSSANAKTTLNMDAETLRKVFLEFDMAAAMQAFMTGKIKVQGDMSQLMALQTAKPSQEQKDLFKKVLEQTA
ncbi:unnamed protein product [Oppiella nova]|uniref:tRNA 2-thiocytidine biosynthesis protein TtcA n=2 Tax=cellular organisms TaxID=131567 RepID=A0A7R9QA72_9ACAR|nr:unnamed protein product [Oppiella nova]CAG2158192.1 unnamed protein product [Oppiella nova]